VYVSVRNRLNTDGRLYECMHEYRLAASNEWKSV